MIHMSEIRHSIDLPPYKNKSTIAIYTMTTISPIADTTTAELIHRYDFIYVDASSWMSSEMEAFIRHAAPVIEESGHKLILTANVTRELENCATLKYAAQNARKLITDYAHLITEEEGVATDGTADGEFVRLFFFNHRKRNQLLITHDQQLTADIQNCCRNNPSSDKYSTSVMTLWPGGELISLNEMVQRREQQARARLLEIVESAPLYIDASSLSNENISAFLNNISEPLNSVDKKLLITGNSLSIAGQDVLPPSSESIIDIIPTDSSMSEADALLGELYLNPANMGKERVVLITGDISLANELRLRRPKSDRFPLADFMTINKYGYLSYLRLTEQQQSVTAPNAAPRVRQYDAPTYPKTRYIPTERPTERKPAAFVPQLIGAIKNEDIEAMCNYIAKGANLRNGIITALCQGKDRCLRVLIETADKEIDAGCFEWWVTNFNAFDDPAYLANNREHFELLQMLAEKSAPMNKLYRTMITLAERVSCDYAAHEQLWTIIRLAISKQAPEAVYAHSTGETLLEIARRQGNSTMIDFLQSR